jgi:hypothetical protein
MSPPEENLDAVALDETCYQADRALMEEYQKFSTEILRAGFTGTALVGLMVIFFGEKLERAWLVLYVSTALLVSSAGFGLGHRWCSLAAFANHLRSLRCFKSQGWQHETGYYLYRRSLCNFFAAAFLFGACLFLFAGVVAMAIGFLLCLG